MWHKDNNKLGIKIHKNLLIEENWKERKKIKNVKEEKLSKVILPITVLSIMKYEKVPLNSKIKNQKYLKISRTL